MMPIIESQAQRDALIELCNNVLGDHILYGGNSDEELIYKIALAALEAKPEYNTSHAEDINLDVSKTAYDRCHPDYRWVSYDAPPVPVLKPVELDSSEYATLPDGFYLKRDDVIKAIREAGYPIAGEDQ